MTKCFVGVSEEVQREEVVMQEKKEPDRRSLELQRHYFIIVTFCPEFSLVRRIDHSLIFR